MSWGRTDTTGTSTSNIVSTAALLMYADNHVAAADEYVTKLRLYCADVTSAADFVAIMGVYQRNASSSLATPVAGTFESIVMGGSAGWVEVDIDPPVQLTEGQSYCRFLTRGQDSLAGNVYRIAATGHSRYLDGGAHSVAPNPYGSSAGVNFDYVMEVVTVIGDPSTGINPTGTDTTAYPGQSRTAVMQNVVATPNAIAYVYSDTIVSTHTDFDWTAGDDGAGVITYTVAQGNLPYGNTDLVIRVSFDSGDPVTLSGMELTVEPDYQYVVVGADPVFGVMESIVFNYEGGDPEQGHQVRVPLLTDEDGEINVVPALTYEVANYPGATPGSDGFAARYWDGTNWVDYLVIVNLSGGEPTEATILGVGTIRIGGTSAVSVGGFSGAVNDGTLDGVALTAASNTSITIPGLVDTAEAPRPGSRTLSLTDGDDTADLSVPVNAPSGWSYYAITANFSEAINGVASSFLPDGAAADDFILYPSPKNNISDNGIGTSFVGTQEFFHLDNATNIATAFDVTTGAGAAAFGGSASGTNKMHAVKMTARKMGN